MLLNNSLFDSVISYLSEKKDFSIQSLYKTISKKEKISLSQFYKIIDDLLKRQILAKE